MKYLLCIVFLLSGCTRTENPDEAYALVEFASRLEEEYHKLHPPKKDETSGPHQNR